MSETQQAPQQAPSLGINDIAMAVRIIDVSAERGAFRGPELASVGKVRDTLAAFVSANQPTEEDGKGEEAPAAE